MNRHVLIAGLLTTALCSTALSQIVRTSRPEGFDFTAPSYATGEERQAQPNLWVFEINFKSVRMIEVETTDARTGQKKKDLVYYLVYRAVNREIARKQDQTDTRPINKFDDPPGPDLFVPDVILVTDDNGRRTVVKDEVVPEAQTIIQKRERRRLLNTIEAVGPVPAAEAVDAEDPATLYGVVIFRNIDPRTDYFTLYMSGFSNGYKLVKGPVAYDTLRQLATDEDLEVNDQVWDGRLESEWRSAAEVGDLFDENRTPPEGATNRQWYYTVSPDRADDTTTVWRKTLVQKYWRPGDELDQNEREIRTQGSARWIYRPDDLAAKKTAPATAAIRRSVRKK